MLKVNMHEAKTRLSQLVEDLESGRQEQIVIARNGKPVARLTGISKPADISTRIGIARGKFAAPEPSAELDESVAEFFYGRKPK